MKEITIECSGCNGSGLYVGMAERDGSAVICHHCKGTGKTTFKYNEFTGLKIREDILRVFKTTCGYVHSSLRHWTETAAQVKHWPINEIWPDWIWLGVSVENQETADERIPVLLQIPAAVRFVSYEPALGPINIEPFLQYEPFHENYKMTFDASEWRGIDWLIAGGESGHGARPAHPDWFRRVRDDCQGAGVAFFMEQLHINGKLVKDIEKFPEDLRIREFPEAR